MPYHYPLANLQQADMNTFDIGVCLAASISGLPLSLKRVKTDAESTLTGDS